LDTPTARRRLEVRRKPYYFNIDQGLHLGYRRSADFGRWVVRRYIGNQAYKVVALDGVADDTRDPDGVGVLSFSQAQARARELHAKLSAGALPSSAPLTVKKACEDYIEFLRAERKTAHDTEIRLAKHVYPSLGERPIALLTTKEIAKCRAAMVRRDDDDPETERRSKDSANRVLGMFRAALNRAFNDEDNGIPSDAAWRRIEPFKNVGRARQVHLDAKQWDRLVNVCQGAFRNLVAVALLTGARAPHELASLRVRDFRADLGTLSVDGKTGQRDIVLTAEAVRWLESIAAGRAPDALLLPRDDGAAWGKNHHIRPTQDAVKKAKLPAACTIYSLRHTYASQSILAGMNLKLLAENMGTSIRMLEVHYGKFIAASRRKLVEESAFKLGVRAPRKVVPIGSAS
jgi:integrase